MINTTTFHNPIRSTAVIQSVVSKGVFTGYIPPALKMGSSFLGLVQLSS